MSRIPDVIHIQGRLPCVEVERFKVELAAKYGHKAPLLIVTPYPVTWRKEDRGSAVKCFLWLALLALADAALVAWRHTLSDLAFYAFLVVVGVASACWMISLLRIRGRLDA